MAGALVHGGIGFPLLRSLSICMTRDEGLLEAARWSEIFLKSPSESSLLSSTSANLQAEGASNLYIFAAFSTLGSGVRVPRKTPLSIQRMLTMRRSAGFLAPFRISYIAAMSSS